MNTLHSYLAYYLLAINAVTFIVYGIDKYKAKKAKWRISEATLFLLAVLGGSIGAWIGICLVYTSRTRRPKYFLLDLLNHAINQSATRQSKPSNFGKAVFVNCPA